MTIDAEKRPSKFSATLIGALVLLILAGAWYALVWKACLKETGGQFTYGLDDPYIHLAIARNFALHGVWGVTPFSQSAASSSPLWIALLAIAIRVGGDWVFWPLIFGILFALASLLLFYYRLVRTGFAAPYAAAGSMAMFAIAPLHILPFTGMEHTLQIFLDLMFAFWLLDVASRPAERKDFGSALALTALICLCRYESVFLIVVPFCVFVWRKEWRVAAGLAIGPILAIGGFGLFAVMLGMPALPNSIVLKGTVPHTFSIPWFQALYLHLRGRSLSLSDLFVICVVLGFVMRLKALRASTSSLQVLCWTTVVACLLHAGLAAIGIFYRYEAYLLVLTTTVVLLFLREVTVASGPSDGLPVTKVQWLAALGVVIVAQFVLAPIFWVYQIGANLVVAVYGIGIVGLVAMETGTRTRGRLVRAMAASLLMLALYFTVRLRAEQAYADIPNAASDVYLQQYQMARFVEQYYPDKRLVANDIGALSYFTHVHLLDLWGLASDNVRKLKVDKNWTTATIKQEIDRFKPDIVIAYPQWFLGDRRLPDFLVPVATWTIPTMTSAGRRVVMFYAPSQAAAERMHSQLVQFQSSLPAKVSVLYGNEAVSRLPRF